MTGEEKDKEYCSCNQPFVRRDFKLLAIEKKINGETIK